MVNLGNGYFAIPTNYGYNLAEDRGQIDKKTGEKAFFSISYHGSLASCVNAAMMELQRKKLSERDYDLREAIEELSKIQRQFIVVPQNAIGSKESVESQN